MKGLAAARQRALGLEILKKQLELDLLLARDAEGAGDVAAGHTGGRLFSVWSSCAAHESEHLVARRQGAAATLRRIGRLARRAPHGP